MAAGTVRGDCRQEEKGEARGAGNPTKPWLVWKLKVVCVCISEYRYIETNTGL